MSLPVTAVTAGATPLPRFVARVAGDDALTFLHDTTSQDLTGLGPGDAALTCYLDEKGRLLAELRVTIGPAGDVLLDGDEAGRDAVLERLARIAPLSAVTIEAVALTVTAVRGIEDSAVGQGHVAEHDGARIVRNDWEGGYDVIGPVPADVPAVPFEAYERGRIAAGRPRFGTDVAPGTLINETPFFARAVSGTKGCYPGQESVARVANLGAIRRRVVLLRSDHPLPAAPADVSVEGDPVGTLTSAAGTLGLATVPASLEPSAALVVSGTPATLERPL